MDFADLIPVAGILASLGFAWLFVKYRQLSLEHQRSEREAMLNSDEKKRLESRLAVLERLAMDRGIETAEQIEALRDPIAR